jgi:hypothetical protein
MKTKLLALGVCLAIVAVLVPSYVGATSYVTVGAPGSGGVTQILGPFYVGPGNIGCYYYVYLSDSACHELVSIMEGGGTVDSVAAVITGFLAIPAWVALAVAAPIIAYYIYEINDYDRYRSGIIMKLVGGLYVGCDLQPGFIRSQPNCSISICNAATGWPLPYATIEVYAYGNWVETVETNSAGEYQFVFRPGTYELDVSAPGFSTEPLCYIEADQNELTTVTFELTPECPGGIVPDTPDRTA